MSAKIDVVQDSVVDACNRLGCQFVESLFYRAALEQGFGDQSERKAGELNQLWQRSGYNALDLWVKKFILRVTNGEVAPAIG